MTKLGAVFFVVFFPFSAMAECLCSGGAIRFTTVNPEDVKHMEEFPWKLHSCEKVQEEFGIETVVYVELVLDHDPAFDVYVPAEDGNELIFVPQTGTWERFDKLVPLLAEMCGGQLS